ncbi:MAG: four helix bundle protein [Bacteroidia bacterium]|nr:four helix bundle protein [Bacteroidia bacterium]
MHNFRNLKVWQKAIELSTKIYSLTKNFPAEEKFGIISQIRRAAVAIASNIAEGAGRNSEKEFCYFLQVSLGSSYEMETQIVIAGNLNFLNDEAFNDTIISITEIKRMISGFQKSMENQIKVHA